MLRAIGKRLTTGLVAAALVTTGLTALAGPAQAAPARPSAATTGVRAGHTLSPMTGGQVTTSGTVIADRVIEGDVVFTGSSLTLRDVRVTGHAVFRGQDVVVEDSEFASLALSGARNVRLSRVDVFGNTGQDGLHITSDAGRVGDVVVEDTWIHDPKVTATSHYDGIQVRGVDRLTLRRVAIELGAFAPQHNAALFLENANGGNTSVTVEDSWLTGGGYPVYSFGTDVRIRRTVIGGGQWGWLFPGSWVQHVTEFAGNVTPNGAAITLPAQGGAQGSSGTTAGTGGSTQSGADSSRRTADEAFVRALYRDFLDREASAGEVAHWADQLARGVSRHTVATSLASSDQWISTVVTRFYRDTLGRGPDAPGLRSWITSARGGTPISTIAAGFYASDEYLNRLAGGDLRRWVTDLYRKLLYRAPDGPGLNHWLALLRGGESRLAVASAFYGADETTRVRIDDLYRALLGRGAESQGLATWAPIVRAQGDLVLAAHIAASDEYYQRAQRR